MRRVPADCSQRFLFSFNIANDLNQWEWSRELLPADREALLPLTPRTILPVLAGLCAIAYWPALNNGFIADDYVILDRVTTWNADFSYLFGMSPEKFRITSYLAFGLLKGLFGYHAAGFYCFAILLHILNAVLLWKFLALMTGSPRIAVLGSMLFAVGQSPQEAVMWLSGINESLQAAFLLAALLLWIRKRLLWSAAACIAALLSKESAVVVLLLLPLTELASERRLFRRRHILYIAIPVSVSVVIFACSLPNNVLVVGGYYGFGLHAVLVWIKSIHRLMFPWLYLAALLWFAARRHSWPRQATAGILWMTASLLPYIFLTYQDHVPSRHTYLASIGFAWALAVLLEEIRIDRLKVAFVAGFTVINIGYLWMVKDRQYQERAAPTARLLVELESHPPGPVLIESFPMNPWIAKMTTRLVPGWGPEMITVNEPGERCTGCLRLHWDSKTGKYSSF